MVFTSSIVGFCFDGEKSQLRCTCTTRFRFRTELGSVAHHVLKKGSSSVAAVKPKAKKSANDSKQTEDGKVSSSSDVAGANGEPTTKNDRSEKESKAEAQQNARWLAKQNDWWDANYNKWSASSYLRT